MLKVLGRVSTLTLRKILLYDYIYYFIFAISVIFVIFRINFSYVDYSYLDSDNYTGVITDFYVDTEKIVFDLDGKVKVRCNYYYEEYLDDLSLGDKVKVYGEIYVPSDNTNPNLFNYRNYLKSKKINYLITVSNYEKIDDNSNIFYEVKNFVISIINSNPSFKYLHSFILGDNRYMDSSIKIIYQELGISHLFSVSGMNISLLSSFIIFILKKMNFSERFRYFLVSLFTIFFMFLVSFCPSVLRSGIFFILITINNLYYFHIKPINLLLVTVSLIMFFNPFIIYNNGFLYSSIITGALIVFSNFINKYNNYFVKLLMTSFISFMFSFPLSIYSYYQINILSIFYNLIFVPLVSIVIFPLSLVCLFLPFISPFFNVLINIMEFLAIKLSSINANVIFMKPNLFILILYYFLIFMIFYYRKKVFSLIFFVFIFVHYNYNVFFSSNYMLMIDIGQGDSVLLHSGIYNILVDTGGVSYGDSTLASNTLIPLFKSLGIRKIDYMFLTHGDYDHVGEAISLINNFSVEMVYFNEGNFSYNEEKIIDLLEFRNINYSISYEGDYYKIGDYSLYSLGTDLEDENDSSMILYGLIDSYSFLLMGDASIKSEEVLLSKYNISDIDILKVGHHGSRTSSGKEFVNSINPKYSLISVGKDNKFDHPNKEVLDILENSIILRTDQDGSVMLKFKNNKLKIETCSS